jgi:Domain of unknown function (DUF3597)
LRREGHAPGQHEKLWLTGQAKRIAYGSLRCIGLNWRTSIVDLMKLQARKELAQKLHYSGDMNDSATMNVWLHKQVMQKLAENGGKVPDDLRS